MKEVIVYTQNVCPWCARLKAFIQGNGGIVIERNIEKSVKAFEEWSKLHVMGVPVAVVNGETLIGFTESTRAKLLNYLNGDDCIDN